MKTLNYHAIPKYLIGSKFIGAGYCAICFKTSDSQVLKIYYNSESTRKFYDYYHNDLNGLFTFLNSFNNDTFYGPVDIFLKNDRVVGYLHECAEGKLIKNIDPSLEIDQFIYLFQMFESKMIEATCKGLYLFDVHQKNVIIGENIKIVDLDFFRKNKKSTYSDLLQFNFRKIIPVLTKALFKIPDKMDLLFNDKTLQDLFIKAIYRDYLAYYTLLSALKHEGRTIEDIRKRKLIYTKKHESYYSKGII